MTECRFGPDMGKCAYGLSEFLEGTRPELITEQMKAFVDANCTPCLEAKKIYVLEGIQRELSWIREAQDNR